MPIGMETGLVLATEDGPILCRCRGRGSDEFPGPMLVFCGALLPDDCGRVAIGADDPSTGFALEGPETFRGRATLAWAVSRAIR